MRTPNCKLDCCRYTYFLERQVTEQEPQDSPFHKQLIIVSILGAYSDLANGKLLQPGNAQRN